MAIGLWGALDAKGGGGRCATSVDEGALRFETHAKTDSDLREVVQALGGAGPKFQLVNTTVAGRPQPVHDVCQEMNADCAGAGVWRSKV